VRSGGQSGHFEGSLGSKHSSAPTPAIMREFFPWPRCLSLGQSTSAFYRVLLNSFSPRMSLWFPTAILLFYFGIVRQNLPGVGHESHSEGSRYALFSSNIH